MSVNNMQGVRLEKLRLCTFESLNYTKHVPIPFHHDTSSAEAIRFLDKRGSKMFIHALVQTSYSVKFMKHKTGHIIEPDSARIAKSLSDAQLDFIPSFYSLTPKTMQNTASRSFAIFSQSNADLLSIDISQSWYPNCSVCCGNSSIPYIKYTDKRILYRSR